MHTEPFIMVVERENMDAKINDDEKFNKKKIANCITMLRSSVKFIWHTL